MTLREAIVQAYKSAKAPGRKNQVVRRYEGVVNKRTVLRIIAKYEQCGHVNPSPKSGRPVVLATKKKQAQLRKMVDHKDKVSDTAVAKKLGWSRSYVQKVRAQKLGIRKYKKRRAPAYHRGQDVEAKKKCRRLLRTAFPPGSDDLIVMDDEHYVSLDQSLSTSNKFFNSSNVQETPLEKQVAPVRKFSPKLMVWQAISMRGRSALYIAPSGMNVTAQLYLEECIKKRLLPFLEEKYPGGDAVFWPDKASAHYARPVVQYLLDMGVEIVEKEDNPTNLPQARPVERYWAEIDRRLGLYKNPALNLDQLARRVGTVVKNIPDSFVQELMHGVRTKLRRISDQGVYSVQ